MAGCGLGLSRTAIALKPLASARRGQGATPTPPKTVHIDACNSRKISLKIEQTVDVRRFIYYLESHDYSEATNSSN